MNAPYKNRNIQLPKQPRRSIDERYQHYELLKAGINSNTNLTREQYDIAMQDAKRIAGV